VGLEGWGGGGGGELLVLMFEVEKSFVLSHASGCKRVRTYIYFRFKS
jgi:hypothetical protein